MNEAHAVRSLRCLYCEDAGYRMAGHTYEAEKGQQAVQATFAELSIVWERFGSLPPGWAGASINLPKLIEGFPTHSLTKIRHGPVPGQVIAAFDYAKRLAVSLVDAGCRVIDKEGDKATDFKLLHFR